MKYPYYTKYQPWLLLYIITIPLISYIYGVVLDRVFPSCRWWWEISVSCQQRCWARKPKRKVWTSPCSTAAWWSWDGELEGFHERILKCGSWQCDRLHNLNFGASPRTAVDGHGIHPPHRPVPLLGKLHRMSLDVALEGSQKWSVWSFLVQHPWFLLMKILVLVRKIRSCFRITHSAR